MESTGVPGGGMPQSAEQAAQQQQQQQAAEEKREVMLTAVLTPEARDRLQRVHLVKPDKARQVEDAILARAQRGQISEKVSQEMVIQMLQAGGGGGERSGGPGVSFRRRNLEDDDEW